MTDLKAQKRLAADILGVGKNRVRFDPDAQSEIADAITRDDVRELIDSGVIQANEAKSNSAAVPESARKSAHTATGRDTGPGRGKPAGDRTKRTSGGVGSAPNVESSESSTTRRD